MTDPDHRYLIVGGTTKAASTSLYFYLSAHRDICAASMKEPRFFLSVDYPVPSSHRLERDGFARYLSFYEHCPEASLRMEATPDYLHSRPTPAWIAEHLPRAGALFVLREPISRLVSWYRFAREDGRVGDDVSFRAFVDAQVTDDEIRDAPQHLRVLRQGRYADDLERWLEKLGPGRVLTVFFEDLVSDARPVLDTICRFAGLESDRFEDLDLSVHNPTRGTRFAWMHRAYKKARYLIRQRTHDRPALQRSLRWLRLRLEPVYWWLNASDRPEARVPDDLREDLVDYYRDSVARLGSLVDAPLPAAWRDEYL